MKLEIVNDTKLFISCNIIANGKHYIYESRNQSLPYEINPEEGIVNIQLYKEDIWKNKSTLSLFLFAIYAMDLEFGNLLEPNNLPFSINHQLTLKNANLDTEQRIFLSNIIKVDYESLKRWAKYSSFQCSMISAMIFIIGLILSFIFDGWIKMSFLICIAILSIFLYKLSTKNKIKTLTTLKTFL